MKAWLSSHAKAIAALVAPPVVALALHFGFSVDVNTATLAITAAITALAVHLKANKGA
jgi:hypothetical protein